MCSLTDIFTNIIERDELCISRQAIYMRDGRDMHSSNLPTTCFHDGVHNATQQQIIVDSRKVRRLLDITVYLSHEPETQVYRVNIQTILVVKIEVL